jgi:hypothetical protein
MFHLNMRCVYCKSSELIEDYKGAELTCTKCGEVGRVEAIPSVYSLETLIDNLETPEERLCRDMEAFAKEIVHNMDVSDLLCNLTFGQLRRRARRHNDPMLVDTCYYPTKRVSLKMLYRRYRVYRHKPY